jgi:diguanylate cyclase
MKQSYVERSTIEHNLSLAKDRNEFKLYYQPQVDIVDNKIVSLEALIRWDNAELGFISPDRFITIAEEKNLIVELTDWVLLTACQHLNQLHQMGFLDLKLSINISTKYLKQRNISSHVFSIIEQAGVDPKLLEFEVTENTFLQNNKESLNNMSDFKAKGITMLVDDFGTGCSSITNLKKFPVDKIKIDKSIIQKITLDSNELELITAIFALTKVLQLDVIAKGVETLEQLKLLQQQQCRFVQGFLFSQPLDENSIITYLKQEEHKKVEIKQVN